MAAHESGRATRPRRPTIQQVAAAAGVSIATVSRVMSGRGTVHAELATRVHEAAERLGYRPSAAAQGLATGRSRAVGIIVPNLANPYFNDLVRAITIAAAADGYHTLIADADEDPAEEVELSRNLARGTDVLVLVSPRMPAADLEGLEGLAHGVVLVNREAGGVAMPSVAVDNVGAVLELAGHLATLGHRHVVYLAGPPSSWQAGERVRAIGQAAAFGLRSTVLEAGGTLEAGYAAAGDALATGATAIACFNDLVALGVLARLDELGVAVPGDVSLTGFDDIPFARYSRPRLTTAATPQRDLGRAAWELAAQVIRRERPPQLPPLAAPLVVRGSTAPPRP